MSGQTFSFEQDQAPLTVQLSGLLAAPVEEADRRRAGLHLLDWAACAIAGRVEPAGRILLQQMEHTAGARAFAWGGLGNILEMDDVDKRALLHPGPGIIPAVLALAIETDVSGLDVLDAIVRGYEATIRLGRAVGPGHYAFWHNTGTCGSIGAAAASASLLKLGEAARAQALALAVSQSAGLWQTRHEPLSMGKQLHTALAARAGLDAARLAAAGFLGPLTVLEGSQGFFAAMCPGADPSAVVAGFHGWRIHEVSFKPWPACRHVHAAIDAALALREQVDVKESREEILVETYADALTFCDRPEPRTVIEAKFSLQHSVAVALLRGRPQLADFTLEAIADPRIAALRKRVKAQASGEFTRLYPERFGAATSFQGHVAAVQDALGDPERPVSVADLHAKAASLIAAGGVRDEEAGRMIPTAASASGSFLQTLRSVLA